MGDDDNINLNISEICRLCLTHEERMLPIFDNKAGGQAPPLPVKIMTCASVKVSFVKSLSSRVQCNDKLSVMLNYVAL